MTITVKDATGINRTVKTIDDLLDASGEVTPDNPLDVELQPGTAHVGRIGGTTRRPSASFVRPSSATTYTAGDVIANSATAGSVTPMEFEVARVPNGSGRITGATCYIEAASGSVVLPKFDLLLFRPQGNVPFGSGLYLADNAPWNLTAVQMAQLVAVISFSELRWRNRIGGNTGSGTLLWQSAPITPRQFAPFDLNPLGVNFLRGMLQVQNAWAPGAVANTFTFNLDVDQD